MDFQSEFPQDTDLIYLNHAAVAPWPKRTQEAVQNFAKENLIQGATHYPDWLKTEQSLRENLKTLINARSTSESLWLKTHQKPSRLLLMVSTGKLEMRSSSATKNFRLTQSYGNHSLNSE